MNKRALVLFALLCIAASAHAAQTRHTFIISDLHLGVGKEEGGDEWLATEDFRWASDFKAFLAQLSVDSGDATDLIIAGDMFELWQPLDKHDCEHANRNFGCSEVEAQARMRRVLVEHDDEIQALATFARRGSNRVFIVPGNHDAALFFLGVQAFLATALGDASARVTVSTDGYWLSEDKKILVEHGQQVGRDVNRFDRWPQPATAPYLQRTWGEQFVQSFYNQYEEKYPVIDNISDNGGISYGLSAERLKGTGMALGKFLRFYLAGSSWAQFVSSLGEPGAAPPQWDVDRIRANGDVFFYESLPAEDPLRSVAEAAYEEGSLGMTLSDLSDEEIRSICESRYALYSRQTANSPHPPPTIAPCASRGPLGAGAQALFGPARDKLVKARARELLKNLRDSGKLTASFDLYVYGHTHSAYPPQPIKVDASWTFESVNTGAWQRIASPAQFEALACGKKPAESLRMSLGRLPTCYPVVRVKPYTLKPSSELLYWNESGGNGSLDPSCLWTAPTCS